MASSPQPGEKRKVEDISFDAPLDNIVDIDPDGDLVLVVGADRVGSTSTLLSVEKTVAFRVDYKTSARNSSVFKTRFDTKSDNFKPGTSEVGWTEHLPDDSPRGLRFLLLVAHFGGFKKVPEKQTFQDVYEIVEMAMKYDMLPLLEGKAKYWFSDTISIAPVFLSIPEPAKASYLVRYLRVAFGLGKRDQVVKVIEYIICRSYIKNGQLTLHEQNLEDPKFTRTNPFMMQYWKVFRLRILKDMRQALHDFMQQLLGKEAFPQYEKCPNHRSQNVEDDICESTALGTLERSLAKRGEWPLPDPEHMDSWTISTVKTAWCSLEIRGFSDSIQKKYRKYECDWASKLQQRISTVAGMSITFTNDLEDGLKERAILVGL